MGQQSAFCVAAEAFFGVVRVGDQDQLPRLVHVLGFVARGIGEADHLTEVVVLPNAGFAGAVGVLDKLPGIVVSKGLFVAVGVFDGARQARCGVGVFGGVAQRVDGFDQVALIVVITQPQATFGVADFDQLVVIVVGVVHDAVVGAGMFEQVAAIVVRVAVGAAVGMYVAHDVFRVVTE